jgi:hypothetical protein
MFRNPLCVRANKTPYTLIVEPWAEEFAVKPGEECYVVAVHPEYPPSFTVERRDFGLMVWVNESGAIYEFWRDEQMIFSTPVPIP